MPRGFSERLGVETSVPVNPLSRYWRVLVREQDGGESEGTYEQPTGEPPPIPQVVIAVGGRRVVVDDVSTVDPPPGRVGVIRARPVAGTPGG
jgi:hypothetical protein